MFGPLSSLLLLIKSITTKTRIGMISPIIKNPRIPRRQYKVLILLAKSSRLNLLTFQLYDMKNSKRLVQFIL